MWVIPSPRDQTRWPIHRYQRRYQGSHTAQIMAKVYRHNGEWKMHAIGENGSGRTINDLFTQITPYL